VLVLPAEHLRKEILEKLVPSEGEKRANLFRDRSADVDHGWAHLLNGNDNGTAAQRILGCSACVIQTQHTREQRERDDAYAYPQISQRLTVTHLSPVAGCQLSVAFSAISCQLSAFSSIRQPYFVHCFFPVPLCYGFTDNR
jgi:hypothetical protein